MVIEKTCVNNGREHTNVELSHSHFYHFFFMFIFYVIPANAYMIHLDIMETFQFD